eukprot:1160265-Pelagomonas_calceolata.AAC.1
MSRPASSVVHVITDSCSSAMSRPASSVVDVTESGHECIFELKAFEHAIPGGMKCSQAYDLKAFSHCFPAILCNLMVA